MSKGSKTQTVTQQTQIPGYIEDAQRALLGKTQELIEPYLTDPGSRVAPLDRAHTDAFNSIRNVHDQAMFRDGAARFQDPRLMDYLTPGQNMGKAKDYFADMAANAAMQGGQASQINKAEIMDMANPYMRMVGDSAIRQLRDSHDQMSADIGARAAASGAFGGSREAVQRAQLADNYVDKSTDTIANLMAQGYQTGAGLAGQNAAFRDAATGRGMQGMLNAANLGLSGNAQAAQLDMRGVENINNTDLAFGRAANDAFGDDINRRLTAANSMAGVGDVMRGYEQQQLDVPYNLLNQYSGIVPGVTGSSSSSTQPIYSNPASSILGSALMFGGMFG